MRETLGNLEPQLRPLNEFVEAEEMNLSALERNMTDAEMGFLSRSLARHAESLRELVGETRRHIEAQRAPFVRYDADARNAVDVALARRDTDLSALEQNLAEQGRVIHRLLETMRSEPFVAARDLLLAREAVLEELAAGGAQLRCVLAVTDAADARLAGAGGTTRAGSGGRAPQVGPDGRGCSRARGHGCVRGADGWGAGAAPLKVASTLGVAMSAAATRVRRCSRVASRRAVP